MPVYVNARIGKGVTGWYYRLYYSLCTSMLNSALLQTWACRSFRLRLKCDGTSAETRLRLSARRASPFNP